MSGLDQDLVRYAVATARQHGFRKVKLRFGEDRFSAIVDLTEEFESEHKSSVADTVAEESAAPPEAVVTAPVVGYFRDPKETLKPGAIVAAGDSVGEIVALGLANDVFVKSGGEVVEVFVSPGDAVEYGQVLATVKS